MVGWGSERTIVAKERKRVAFYDTVVETTTEDGKTSTKNVRDDFWPATLDRIADITNHTKRIQYASGKRHYGAALDSVSPAFRYLQVYHLRDLSEHLEQTDLSSGSVGPLELPANFRVSEPTFVVPFGTKGRVAIMSPGRTTRQETVANWITGVLDLPPKGKSIRFLPVVDQSAIDRITNSQGAVGIEFKVNADETLPADGNLPLLTAVNELRASGPDTGVITIGWSLGRKGGTHNDQGIIKSIALKIATGDFARRGKVNLVLEDEDGSLHREEHDLLEDQIVTKVTYQVDADTRTSTDVVLTAIGGAIDEFNKRSPVGGIG
jgi:hypothetical protein